MLPCACCYRCSQSAYTVTRLHADERDEGKSGLVPRTRDSRSVERGGEAARADGGPQAPGGKRRVQAPDLPPPPLVVTEVWCRRRIPVEGNFGQTYDSLNQSVHDLDGDFSATIELKEEKQAAVVGANTSWEHVSTELRDYVRQQEARLQWTLGLLHVLFSCTFLLVLHA